MSGLAMESVYLFNLASQQGRWLAARHVAVSANIANANTPGYKAVDVPPFEAVFNDATAVLTTTSPLHIGFDPMSRDALPVRDASPWEVSHSGNSVSLEQELLRSGEVTAAYSLNTAVTKSFNRMLMESLKG
ncbi:MAG TPA: flagellar basal body protein [Methylocella sp.]|nr:flagellar basal body protein [Methylocella sp.]